MIELVYNHFMQKDIDNFDFINDGPITTIYVNSRDMNIPTLAYILEQLIDMNNNKENLNYTSSLLFELYREYISNSNIKFEITSTRFGIDITSCEGINNDRDCTRIYIHVEQLKTYATNTYKFEFSNNNNNSECIDKEDPCTLR